MPLRFDRAELPAPERTKEGFLRTVAVVARPGVLEYPQKDGTVVRELVTADVLAASAQALGDCVITLRHPTNPDGTPLRVNKDNASKFSVGHTRETITINEDGSVSVPVTITDAKAIDAIDKGMRGVSPLYDVDTIPAPPNSVHPTFGRYTHIQTKRTPAGTIAICPLGRGGPQCHLRADDSEAIIEIEGGEAQPRADEAAIPPAATAGTAREILQAAIARHERHMAGTEPTSEPSQQAMMDEMRAALAAMPMESPGDDVPASAKAMAALLNVLGVTTIEEALRKLEAEWGELITKRAALDAMLSLLACDTADAAKAKIAALSAPPSTMRADSVEARSWFHDRSKLHVAAVAAGMTIPEIDALGDDDLRKAVVLKRQPTLRADEAPAYYRAAFDMAPPVDHLAPLRLSGKAAPAPDVGLRADAAPASPKPASRWDDAFNKPAAKPAGATPSTRS